MAVVESGRRRSVTAVELAMAEPAVHAECGPRPCGRGAVSGIFISHSSHDRLAAAELAERLRAQGYESLFLDFDPADGIPAGRNWEREIYARLRACSAVVVLCSVQSMASDWCFAEITHARALGKQLFPLLLDDCELRALLRDTQAIDLRGEREAGYARLWHGMRSAGLDPADSFAWDSRRAPYPGLAPFQAADAAVYFGRDDDQRRCLDALAQMRRYGGEHLLVLVGASGSGKSSLVRAGVIPRLARMADWRVLGPMRPLRWPDEELARLLGDGAAMPDVGAGGVRGGGERSAGGEASGGGGGGDAPAAVARLLVVDQLEELVTSSEAAAAARFVVALRAALAAEAGELYCLATLRADYLGALQAHPAWAQLPFRELSLGPMTPRHFAEIISRPAEVAGIELEAGLVETLVHDTGSTDALPLLAFTLNRLWHDFGGDGRITLAEYSERIGGLEGAIGQEADAVLAALQPTRAQLEALRRAFRELVRIDPEGQYTRRTLRWQDVPAAIHPLLEAFVGARLLVSAQEVGQEEVGKEAVGKEAVGKEAVGKQAVGKEGGPGGAARTLEVAHEALFRAWGQLRRWLDEDRVFLLWRQHALPEAEAWRRSAEPGLLLRGGPLADALRWQAERDAELGDTLRAFVVASRQAVQRARRRRAALGAGLAASVLALSWTGVDLWQQRKETDRQLINSYWSGAVSARDAADDALKAAHYLARAAELEPPGQARDSALIGIGVLAGGVELAGTVALPAPADGVVVPAEDSVLLAWSGREAWLHDLRSGAVLAQQTHPDAVREAFVVAGRMLVSRDAAGGVWLWGGAAPARTLAAAGVARIAPDPAGRQVLGWGDDGLWLWAVAGGENRGRQLAGSAIAGAAFVDAGSVLAWSAEGQFWRWRIGEAGAPASWQAGCAVRGVDIAADGRSVLSFCDTVLMRHDAAAGKAVARWSSPERVDGARFAADAALVVSWAAGRGRIRVWQAADGAARFERPLDRAGSLARVLLPAGGKRLLSSGADGLLEAWDLASGELAARGRHHHGELPVLAMVDTEGARALAWSGATGARLWDAATLTPLSLPLLHPGRVVGAAFYDGGRALVSWADDGSLRLWRRQPAQELTAPAAVAAATAALPRATAPDAALQARLDALGLHGYRRLDADAERVLVAAGPLARRLGPGRALSPPLTLSEGVRGAALLADERVVLWGNSSVQLWDGAGGQPLSAVLRSDVLFPEQGAVDTELLVGDGARARVWRWPRPDPGALAAAQWLALTSATQMDAQGTIGVLDGAAWCALARAARRPATGCAE